MQLGLIGLPLVGKTTLFELMTGNRSRSAGAKATTAVARVPDTRIDYLSRMYKPKKTTYAQIEAVDIPGLVPGSEREAASFLAAVRDADALIHVVRAFRDENIPYLDDELDPVRDIERIDYELLLADLDLVEKRIERIREGKKKRPEQAEELAVIEKIKAGLENERRIDDLGLSSDEIALLSAYQFLTDKPVVLAINVDEAALAGEAYPGQDQVRRYAEEHGLPLIELSARIENEISELDGDEREMFMQDLGLTEPAMNRLMRTVYSRLGLISFFTVGEDEVKAWTIEQGTVARKAAGKIHSDIERGFIRAEVISYEDLVRCGSMARAREEGLLRLEGKDYVVKDGDIVHFRFNV